MDDDKESGPEAEKESLKDDMRNVIEEARVIIPGIQALFGFQTMAVFNNRFEDMPSEIKAAYLVALGLLVVAIGLLMTPAAYHRLAERGQVSRTMINRSSTLITAGLVPLTFALAIDVHVVVVAAIDNNAVGLCAAAATFTFLAGLWFAFPLAQKRRR
jgi:cobalamin synthase